MGNQHVGLKRGQQTRTKLKKLKNSGDLKKKTKKNKQNKTTTQILTLQMRLQGHIYTNGLANLNTQRENQANISKYNNNHKDNQINRNNKHILK